MLADIPRGAHQEVHEAEKGLGFVAVDHPGYHVLLCNICHDPYAHGNEAPNLTHTCGSHKCRASLRRESS